MKINSTYSYRHIWTVAFPILISLVMEQMIGLTDTAFLGRVGEVELGASAIAIVYYMVMFMIGFGFSIGAQIIIGDVTARAISQIQAKYSGMDSTLFLDFQEYL